MITKLTDIWKELVDWITETVPSVMELFYNSTSGDFTLVGILALVGVGISVGFLLINVVKGFLRLR